MKAVWYEEFGAAEDVLQFGDFKTPEPKAGQVKIRVHASGVNPSDTKKGWVPIQNYWQQAQSSLTVMVRGK